MLDNKAISKKIGGIKTSMKNTRKNVQEVLVNVAGHAYENGRVTDFNALLSASTGLSHSKIIRWVHEYGFARWNEAKQSFTVNKKMKNETHFGGGANTKDSGIEVVKYLTENAVDWYSMTGDVVKEEKPLDITQTLVALRKRIDKAIEKGQEIKSEDFETAMRLLEDKVENLNPTEETIAA